MDGIGNDFLDVWVIERGERFVAGAEIKDFPFAALVAAPAPEHLSALKPTDENKLIRCRNFKPFPVHFFLRKLDIFPDPCGNGVTVFNTPI